MLFSDLCSDWFPMLPLDAVCDANKRGLCNVDLFSSLGHVSVLLQMSFLVDLNSNNLNSLLLHRSVAFSELPWIIWKLTFFPKVFSASRLLFSIKKQQQQQQDAWIMLYSRDTFSNNRENRNIHAHNEKPGFSEKAMHCFLKWAMGIDLLQLSHHVTYFS